MLMDIFNKKAEEVIVADIGEDFKLLNVRLGSRPAITALEVTRFSGENNIEIILKPLSNFIQKNNIPHKNVILIPRLHSLLIKRIQLPAIPKQELLEAIRWHLKPEASFDLSEAALDFSVLKESEREDGSRVVDCLCVMAGQDEIKPQVLPFKQLGLCCLGVVPAVFGYTQLIRRFSLQKVQEAAAVLHMEGESSSISVHKGNKLEFYRELPLSINKLKESLKSTLISNKGKVELSDEEASEVLFNIGVPKEGDSYKGKLSQPQILSMLRPGFERLAREISRSLAYYKTQFHEAEVKDVLIGGRLALVPNIETFLSRELSLGFKKITLPPGLAALPQPSAEDIIPSYAAFGAALDYENNINLLPYEFTCERAESIQRVSLRWVAFIALLILASSYIFAKAGIAGYQRRLDNAILHLNVLSEVRQIKARIDETNNFVAGVKAPELSAGLALKKLSNIAPKELSLGSLSLNYESKTGSLSGVIKGNTLNPDIIMKKFTGDMEGSGYFTEVEFTSLEKVRLKESDIARFVINFKLR